MYFLSLFMNPKKIMPSLCVGIPTYNRPKALCRRLEEIKRFSEIISEILICDNSEESSLDVLEYIKTIDIKCTYIKNPVNIGAGANFLRVLENSSADYLWWRGDDDVISQDQVNAVKDHLSSDHELLLINYQAKNIFISKGVDSFVDNFQNVECMGWASQVIVPTSTAKKGLSWGFKSIDWAHIMVIIRLFHELPGMQYKVIPYILQEGEFRDIGREGLGWAFFNTTIMKFPETASALPSRELKKLYIANWRKTKKFNLVRTMVGMKLGISSQEKITLFTFLPLISIFNFHSTVLALTLYLLSKVPTFIYHILFSIYWTTLVVEKKRSLKLDFLMPCENFSQIYLALRKNYLFTKFD